MFRIIESFATAILLILVMIFVLHLIQGDAWEWLVSKFRVSGGNDELPSVPPLPPIPNDPLPPPPSNQG